ncbi:hypothetical protein Ahy_B01g052024 isoform A [Arachis hypogaea]|uniref:Uncharacterized protein n=1 Tax=Arachis hypogaea TaxID=3818 RepID=A0A445ANJ7_ARAHY|nr:hypothetical protein Ahy_B01g052024 isoform A [Arachis hypogaea]
MGKRGEHIVHLGRGGEGRGGFDMCGVQPSPPPFVAVRGVFLRTVGVIQVKPPVPCLLPRSAPILHRILPARGRPVTVVVVSSPSRSVYSLPGKTDGAFVHQTMDKWPSSNRYSLKAALMINYDPVGPNNGLIYNELDADHLCTSYVTLALFFCILILDILIEIMSIKEKWLNA